MVHKKVLLVEGEEDKRIIPELIQASGIQWGKKEKDWIVEIRALGGVEKLLDKEEIKIQLKASGVEILGIIIDADEYPVKRWESIRNSLLERYPDLPTELPASGLIHSGGAIKVGVWIMPDNRERGMLETFLHFLLPEDGQTLWQHSEKSCTQAKQLSAAFKDCHTDKAKIHTWLAWQDPPGRQMHQAIKERILAPSSAQAAVFIQWFCDLFEIQGRA
jgi:hypothetical protein